MAMGSEEGIDFTSQGIPRELVDSVCRRATGGFVISCQMIGALPRRVALPGVDDQTVRLRPEIRICLFLVGGAHEAELQDIERAPDVFGPGLERAMADRSTEHAHDQKQVLSPDIGFDQPRRLSA